MNKTELVIDLNEFPGGVGLWPSLASAFSSRIADPTNEPVNGIHVHARKKHGKAKVIDFTFPNVFIKANVQSSLVNNELFKIDEIDARAYWAGRIFGANLQLIFCPSCGHVHADHEESAIRNHINHKCKNCGFVFHSEFPCVSNPLMWLKNHFSEFDDTRRPVLVDRVCEIRSEDTIGGIEMWGSAPAILWTNSSVQEEGIHFHLYNASGSKRLIDETYREVKIDEYLIS
jgi:transcription elongation factor Elf1